jgi:Lhr-like helicase
MIPDEKNYMVIDITTRKRIGKLEFRLLLFL